MSNLSDEELFELRKINSLFYRTFKRFRSEKTIFKISYIFVAIYSLSYFVYASNAARFSIIPVELIDIEATYFALLRARLLVMIAIFLAVNFAYAYDKFFKIAVSCLLILLSNYTLDMYYIFAEYFSVLSPVIIILFVTRPFIFLASFLVLIYYDRY